ncbi:MAG: S8 family serine peptidase [Acidobacteriia bacterium]|nr:S8 family serine peptidase [Terriglobia bacterium]
MKSQNGLLSPFVISLFQKTLCVFAVLFLLVSVGYARAAAANQCIIVLEANASIDTVLGFCQARIVRQINDGSTLLIEATDGASGDQLTTRCSQAPGVESAEQNSALTLPRGLTTQVGRLDQSTVSLLNQSTVSLLNQSTVSLLNDATVTNYYGANVKSSYANQPALALIGNDQAHTLSTGTGIVVADIDSGVDPENPILKNVLMAGYNFIDDNQDVSEWTGLDQSTVSLLNQNQAIGLDQSTVSLLNQSTVSLLNQSTVSLLNQSTVSLLNQSTVALLNQSTVALLNQSTVSLLNQSTVSLLNQSTVSLLNQLPPDFGHGTMVAGLIHVVAPNARIQPLKAFGSDGAGTLSDVVRAINYAADQGANVINMSFSFPEGSKVLKRAIHHALSHQVILVASVGNEGKEVKKDVFPAAYNGVYGIASTDDQDIIAPFSNYGKDVSFSAPGVNLVTLYPGGHYALASGTSFSSALVAGVAALSASVGGLVPGQISSAFSLAAAPIDFLNPGFEKKLGEGRVDEAQTVQRAAQTR